jgi:hypothetical protein
MKHHFKNICYNKHELLDGCNKLSTFMSRLKKQSHCPHNKWMHEPEKYYGDGFEAFTEVLINLLGATPSIQIKDYSPITEGDMGVDGVGYGPNGEIHTVQVKARSDVNSVLTANKDHISNFVAHSLAKYNAQHMTIFTTAKGLHEGVSDDMYMGKVRTFGQKELRLLVDNNTMFWQYFRDQLIVNN